MTSPLRRGWPSSASTLPPVVAAGRRLRPGGPDRLARLHLRPAADGRRARCRATGKVGAEVTRRATADDCARTCALNALAAVDALVGLDAVVRVVKVVGFVASDAGLHRPAAGRQRRERAARRGLRRRRRARSLGGRGRGAAARRPGRGRADRRGATSADRRRDAGPRCGDRRAAARRRRRARGVAADPGRRRWSFAAGMAVFPGGRVDDADADLPFGRAPTPTVAARFGCARRWRGRWSAPPCARRSRRPACCSPCRSADLSGARADVEAGRVPFGDLLRRARAARRRRGAAALVALDHPGRRGRAATTPGSSWPPCRPARGAGRHERVVHGRLVRCRELRWTRRSVASSACCRRRSDARRRWLRHATVAEVLAAARGRVADAGPSDRREDRRRRLSRRPARRHVRSRCDPLAVPERRARVRAGAAGDPAGGGGAAANPGPMTLDGTNTWVLRARTPTAVVVDPGPDDDAHLRRARGGGRRSRDPAHPRARRPQRGRAARCTSATGAPVRALDPALCLGDEGLADGAVVVGGRRRAAGAGRRRGTRRTRCRSCSTTGRRVLTGDTILGRGTTVVAYPDGDLADYLASLRAAARTRRRHRAAGARTGARLGRRGGRALPGAPRESDSIRSAPRWPSLAPTRLRARSSSASTPTSTGPLWWAAELSVRAQLAYLRS